MATAMERKARHEERRLKEEKRRCILLSIWTALKYAGAGVAAGVVSTWLAVVMWDHSDWALTISWVVASVTIGAALFKLATK